MIKCPVCKKEKDIDYGKYVCPVCKSKFEYQRGGNIILIKRNKFDYSIFFISLIVPGVVLTSLTFGWLNISDIKDNLLIVGLFFLLYPLLITFRQVLHLDFDELFLNLYSKFFSNELKKEDKGRIIAFYFTAFLNIIGLIFILIHILI